MSGLAEKLLTDLGLPPYQAKVLLALFDGPANSAEIAERSGVPRTSVYLTTDALIKQQPISPVPGYGPRRWEASHHSAVVALRMAAQAAFTDATASIAKFAKLDLGSAR